MEDQPSPIELLQAARSFIEEQAIPRLEGRAAFHARVAANALAIGETLDLTQWPVFTEAVGGAGSVGDFFHRFTMAARRHATSINYELKTDGTEATFKAPITPAAWFPPYVSECSYWRPKYN